MIYFLDNSLQLQKIVTSKNIISAVHEHELNGLIIADIVLDLSYANKFLILGIDHVGYYYKDEFYLHKIQSVEYDHANETALVELRHVFFEDMLFGKLIQDVRPQNQDALFVLRQTIDANTRWQTVMTDVTGRLSTNFYWQVPYEVIEFVTENYRVEYIPKILFDGQKINGFHLHVANKVGEDKNIRIPFGSRVLDLKYEEDYSEIITKLVGHGKGEEVGDGYGRRINISDINFSRNGVESPLGDVYMEDETVTATYGNDGQTPREGRVIFEDIENVNELAQATYEHYLQVSRPQMLFTADVADIGDVGIGDSVMIIRREYDVYFKARIHKLTVDLLYPEDAQVELGDYEHFKESKISRKTREKNNRLHKRNQSLIEQAKRDFDERFNSAVEQFRSEFEQAKIDIFAEIEADLERMQNLLDTKSEQWTEDFNQSVAESKEYAEQQAQEKASKVQTKLDSFKDSHQQLYEEVTSNILDIDKFLGDKSKTLAKQFAEMESGLNQSITAESGRIDAIVTNFGDSGKSLAQFVLDVDSIETTVAKNDDWLGTHGSNLLQTVDRVEQKVWLSDVAEINPNLIPFADTNNPDNSKRWTQFTASYTSSETDENGEIHVRNNNGEYVAVQSETFEINSGKHTLSFIGRTSIPWNTSGLFTYTYLINENGDNIYLGRADYTERIDETRVRHIWNVDVPFSGKARVLIGTVKSQSGVLGRMSFKEPKLERGDQRTLFLNALSHIEQLANKIQLSVADSNGLATTLALSSSAMDIITKNLNITADMNVAGQITTLAVDAIEGNFARLFANQLTANVITSDHIQADTALVKKLFATSARIDVLITESHFVNNVKAMSIEAVEGQFSSLITKYLNANYIDVDYINGKNAWFESQYTLNANIAKLTAQHAFIRDIQAIEITANQLNLTTLTNRINQIEGGLKITRPDGAVWVRNGVYEFSLTMQRNQFMSPSVTWTGQNYTVPDETWRVFETIYAYHDARYITVAFLVSITNNSAHASAYIFVRVREFSSGNALGEFKVLAPKSGTAFQNIQLDLGIPTYSAKQFYLEARMSEDTMGSGVTRNHGLVRVNRAVMKG